VTAFDFTSQVCGLGDLPFDCDKPGRAFRPYSHRAERAVGWLRANALPIAGLIVGVVL